MKKGKKLYEGKAKIIYATSDKNLVIQYFKDDATAFNNKKRKLFNQKGILNNNISSIIFEYLNKNKIKKAHPDKSGNNELASKINRARDVLLQIHK